MSERELKAARGGERLDRFLAGRLEGMSRAWCQGLIVRGLVSVSGIPRPADYRLRAGDVVYARVEGASWPELPFEDWVLFEDAAMIVLNKPSGLLMHPLGESWLRRPEAALSEPAPNLAGLLQRRRPLIVKGGVERCGIVHRLDRGTSGVLVVAKTPEAWESLVGAFKERLARKTYRAIVAGELGREGAEVDAPIGRRPGRRRIQVSPWGKAAKTSFKVVANGRGAACVEATPLTGRTHQIRAHLALMKHPVVGDPEWFRGPEEEGFKALGHPPPPRMMLHAWKLALTHPRTGRRAAFTAPVPADFRAYWKLVSQKVLRKS